MYKMILVILLSLIISGCQTAISEKNDQKSYRVYDNAANINISSRKGLATQFPYSDKYSLTAGHVNDFTKNQNQLSLFFL
mgnify:CR=1 FL=1